MIEYENLKAFNKPFIEEFKKQFDLFLESGWYILGEQVSRFEQEFAKYCGVQYCVGVASGLDALFLALKSLDFKEGDEIIVPSNTYIATILSIANCQLTPVLVEPRIDTYNIDPDKIEEQITPRTKAIMVVHLYGKCCEMDPILEICQRFSLKLIEDCAQAHGAKYKGQIAGSFGDINAFSFYPTKNLGALGDAGAVVTSDNFQEKRIRYLRNYGSSQKYHNELIGYNSRLDEIQAGFLSIKLQSLDKINAHKRTLANEYTKLLKDDFIKPAVANDFFDVYHIYNIRHPRRDSLREYLLKQGIKTEVHYPIPPHQQRALQNFFSDQHFPVSEEIHKTTLSLPISYSHSINDIHQVVETMNKF